MSSARGVPKCFRSYDKQIRRLLPFAPEKLEEDSFQSPRSEMASKGKKNTELAVKAAVVGVPNVVEFDLPRHQHIMELFAAAEVLCLFIPDGFSSELVQEFYTNLEDPSKTQLDGGVQSRVQGQTVTITHEQLRIVFGLSQHSHRLEIVEKFRTDRDWTFVNQVLHNKECMSLISTFSTLTVDALIVQDVLLHTILLKLGDTAKITAQLSFVTYCILERERFDVADLLLSLIRYTYKLCQPSRQRYNNLPLGGIIQRVIQVLYPTIDTGFFLFDSYPPIYSTSHLRASFVSDEPSSSTQPPLRRGSSSRGARDAPYGTFREEMGERMTWVEEDVSVIKKDVSGIKKMMKFMMKALNLNPSTPERREWESPVSDPPRHSIRRTRRRRSPTPSVEDIDEEE